MEGCLYTIVCDDVIAEAEAAKISFDSTKYLLRGLPWNIVPPFPFSLFIVGTIHATF